MSDIRVGALIRAARRRLGLRQIDLAAAAGVSQQTVSMIELGLLGDLRLSLVRRVATAAGVDLPFAPRFRGAEGDRLLDAGHVALVGAVVGRLKELGWDVCVEYSFNHYGERGSVDVIGWRSGVRTLLVVEVKTELVDVQQTLRAIDVKERFVPRLLERERDWRVERVGVVLVLPDERGRRASVARHGAVFDTAFPARTVEVRRWLTEPRGPLRGIWFLNLTNTTGDKPSSVGPRRVRRSEGAREGHSPRSRDGGGTPHDDRRSA